MKLFIRRVILLDIVVVVFAYILFNWQILLILGILCGSFLSVHKTIIYRNLLVAMAQQEKQSTARSVMTGMLQMLLPFVVLLVAAWADQWLFIGMAAGLLSTAMVVLINIITERLNITHNDWAGWF